MSLYEIQHKMIEVVNNNIGFRTDSVRPPKLPTTIIINSLTRTSISGSRSIFIQLEPEAIDPIENKIISSSTNYDFILTFNQKVLNHCKNAYLYLYGTTWISESDYKCIDVHKKKFMLTSLTGGKHIAPGHQYRQHIYNEQLRITSIPIRFFISKHTNSLPVIADNPVLRDSKIELFRESQFSLVIENSRQTNYFTEKLCDCLITKTIPVYYGCLNISDFFDTTGWIILESCSVDEFIEKINVFNEDYYMKYMDVVEKNFETVQRYADISENINRGLCSIPEY